MSSRVCFLLFALTGELLAQDSDTIVFRSDVSLVRVDAQVVDRDNRAITGLRATDFILREEGRPQQIRNFASENMPVDVLMLLDVSASMRPHVQRIADAAHQALRVMGEQDHIGIMVFDRATRLRLPFRANRQEVEREFERLLNQETFHGGTDITRGMYDAASYVGREGRREARRAIVILTDDETEFNRDDAGVSRALTRADAVLCALIAPDAMQYRRNTGGIPQGGGGGSWPGSGPQAGGPLGGIWRPRPPYGGRGGPTMRGPRTHSAGTAEIAQRSGGDSMPVDDAYALENTLARIRQRYALHFNLPQGVRSGEERNIEVSLSDAARQRYPGAEVRYRRVYLAPSDAGKNAGEPTVITRAPVDRSGRNADDDQAPAIRRRPAVSDASGPRQGPLGQPDAPQSSSTSEGSWRRAEQTAPADAASPVDTKPKDTEPTTGGWRKATPDDK